MADFRCDHLLMPFQAMQTKLLAPCGINCFVCRAYLREKNRCPGCRIDSSAKNKSCLRCKIKNCAQLKSRFCFSCKDFPCFLIKRLDKRYRTRYELSVICNQLAIKKAGIMKFLKGETVKWGCPKCGKTLCMHNKDCLFCGEKR